MRLPANQWAQFGLAVMGTAEQIGATNIDSAEAVLGGMAQQQQSIIAAEDLQFHHRQTNHPQIFQNQHSLHHSFDLQLLV